MQQCAKVYIIVNLVDAHTTMGAWGYASDENDSTHDRLETSIEERCEGFTVLKKHRKTIYAELKKRGIERNVTKPIEFDQNGITRLRVEIWFECFQTWKIQELSSCKILLLRWNELLMSRKYFHQLTVPSIYSCRWVKINHTNFVFYSRATNKM